MSTAKKLRKASRDGRLNVWVVSAPEPKREVVRDQHQGGDAMYQPEPERERWAHLAQSGWVLRRHDGSIAAMHRTEAEAIAWCLDGVLP